MIRSSIAGLVLAFALCVLPAHAGQPADPDAPDLGGAMHAVGDMYGIDPDLLMAIAMVESNGRAHAVSPKGAQGLMQLMPETAARFDVADPFDPVENLLGAARFLNYLRQWQQTDPELQHLPELLAAYNAGPGAVRKYGGIPPYPETREYVRRVLWAYLLGVEPPKDFSPRTEAPPRVPHRDGDRQLLEQLSEIRRQRGIALDSSKKVQPASVSR
jgi:hypothetical protein